VYVSASTEPTATATHPAPIMTFESFYKAEYARVVRLLLALTRREIAEEIAQDAFLAAHRRWDSISAYERPDAWVRRVALNGAVSGARRRATEAKLLLRLSPRQVEEPDWLGTTAEVWAAVRALPKRQAQVAALVLVDDRPVAEAAAILECNEETIRTHLRRARIALAARLGATNDDFA
jgi:RNA polymerase sigma factor (sigma-70 family)